MIFVKNTPHNTGVAVYGDYKDFSGLYEALHDIVGDEEEFQNHEAVRIRVLAVCYDLRHAMMGDREFEFVENAMDDFKMRKLSVIAPDKNVYLKINVLWPELLFVMMALNDFILLYAKKKARVSYKSVLDRRNIWDASIAQVRIFQSMVAKCMEETVTQASFTRMMNLMNRDYIWMDNYITQYIDILNGRFLGYSPEKRLKSIPTMAKRLAEQGNEYMEVRSEVIAAAQQYNCPIENIRFSADYPEEIEW
jgi:hypothetical protein